MTWIIPQAPFLQRRGSILDQPNCLDAQISQLVVALFPICDKGIVGHRGTRLVEIGLYSVVHRYFGILALREALAVFDDSSSDGNVAARFVLHPFDHRLYLARFKGIGRLDFAFGFEREGEFLFARVALTGLHSRNRKRGQKALTLPDSLRTYQLSLDFDE